MDRLHGELKVIEKTGFVSYFLIVGDFIRYGHEQGIPCGARGSAAGSIVTYLLEISNVCPIRYGCCSSGSSTRNASTRRILILISRTTAGRT